MTTRALLLALFALLATPVRAQTGITTHDTGHGVATCVRWSPDGRFAATTGHDGRVRAWNAKTWERRELESPAGQHWALAISPDGKHLACGSDFTVRVWRVSSRKKMWSHRDVAIDGPFGKGRGSIHGLAFTPDSKRLAGGMSAIPDAGSRAVCFWDVKKLEDAKIEARGHTAADQPAVVEFVAFTPDGKVMASGGFTRALRVWRFERRGRDRGWKPVCEHPDECENGRQLGHTMCAAFAPDGARLVVGDTRGRIHVYAGAGWRREKSFVAHPGSHVREVCWSVDGRRLYSCGGDLRVWKADSLEAVKTITLPGGAAGRTIMSIAPAPDGKRVACVDSAGALHVIALP